MFLIQAEFLGYERDFSETCVKSSALLRWSGCRLSEESVFVVFHLLFKLFLVFAECGRFPDLKKKKALPQPGHRGAVFINL